MLRCNGELPCNGAAHVATQLAPGPGAPAQFPEAAMLTFHGAVSHYRVELLHAGGARHVELCCGAALHASKGPGTGVAVSRYETASSSTKVRRSRLADV